MVNVGGCVALTQGWRSKDGPSNLAGYVSGNWRIVFRFEGANACDVDLVDYH
jgi:plasmid maintenance system killer protein